MLTPAAVGMICSIGVTYCGIASERLHLDAKVEPPFLNDAPSL